MVLGTVAYCCALTARTSRFAAIGASLALRACTRSQACGARMMQAFSQMLPGRPAKKINGLRTIMGRELRVL